MRRWGVLAATAMVTAFAWVSAAAIVSYSSSLAAEVERAAGLARVEPRAQATLVYDRHGNPAFSFFAEHRIDVPLDRVSRHMIEAIVAVEDRRFFAHHGVDPIRIVSAAWRNLRAGRIAEGGSTITQQLARASQLSPVRTYERKIREILIATQLEARFSKTQILQDYLNTVYFGEGLYGVEAAARGYFGKPAAALELHEAALLAALVRSPSSDSPGVAPARAMKRRNLVLRLMRAQGRISDAQLEASLASAIPRGAAAVSGNVVAAGGPASGLYFQEEVRRQLVSLFGSERVLRGGLRVYTTYDPALQREAEKAITTRIAQIVRRRPAARDLQGSLVAMDPVSGDVLALVGGRSFEASRFNRATQARRQAGSAFKPIVYAAALERGYAPGTLLRDLDAPIQAGSETWLPDGSHERSEYTLRRALKVSSNRAAAQLMQMVGVGTTVYYAQRLGIESRLPMVPSLALGSGEVTLLELTSAYSAFANRGIVASPRLITRVEDASGTAIYHGSERHTQAISAATAFLMSSMLADVVSGGTATAARAAGFKLPAAGKTGTTNDYADAWFIGYTPSLLAGVWFGLDTPAPIMRGGLAGVIAVPAWGAFMRAATTGAAPEWYQAPPDVEKVAICRLTGARASDSCRHHIAPVTPLFDNFGTIAASTAAPVTPGEQPVYEDYFPAASVPLEFCSLGNASPDAIGATDGGAGFGATPLVDAALQNAGVSTSPARRVTVRSASTRITFEKSVGADGVIRYSMKQIQ